MGNRCGRMQHSCPRVENDGRHSEMEGNCGRTEKRESKAKNDCECEKAEEKGCYPCKKDEWKDSPVGMAYVPWQCFRMINDIGDGFQAGTIFKELEKPFEIGFCARRCGCQ